MDVLVASRPRRQAGKVEFMASSTLHAAFLALAVLGTRTTVQAVSRVAPDTSLFYLPRLEPAPVDRPVPRTGGGGGGEVGVVISANPPPRGFQVLSAVGEIPTTIPPVSLDQQPLDPRDFTGRGVEGGVGWGVVGGTGPVDLDPTDGGIREMLYSADAADARFAPAELVERPVFPYPRTLAAAGVPGRVVLQFIIDTLGRVEPGSIQVLETTHPAFASVAREGVLAARFLPARYADRPVRQLSKWPLKFTAGG